MSVLGFLVVRLSLEHVPEHAIAVSGQREQRQRQEVLPKSQQQVRQQKLVKLMSHQKLVSHQKVMRHQNLVRHKKLVRHQKLA